MTLMEFFHTNKPKQHLPQRTQREICAFFKYKVVRCNLLF